MTEPSFSPDGRSTDDPLVIERQQALQEILSISGPVEPARNFDIPEINYMMFGPLSRQVFEICTVLENWLSLPRFEDNFGDDHAERTKWKKAFLARYKNVGVEIMNNWYKNKFRRNILSGPGIHIENLDTTLQGGTFEESELGDRIVELWDVEGTLQTLSNYNDMDIGEKKKFIETMEDRVVQILNLIAEHSADTTSPHMAEE